MHRPGPDVNRLVDSTLRRRTLLLSGAALGATVVAPPLATTAASLPARDVRALNLLLLVEHTQAAFYGEALERGNLESELFRYAEQVASQEREHVDALRQVLGKQAADKPSFEFGDATQRTDAFVAAATEIEDLAVGAYNGQGVIVSPEVLGEAAKIVSVEARHAAWIRSIVGQLPAADATDRALSADEALRSLSGLGMRR